MIKIPRTQSATKFRASLYETLAKVAEGESFLISHRQGQDVVLIGQKQLNALLEEREILRSIGTGVAELDSGKGVPHKKALSKLSRLKSKWK